MERSVWPLTTKGHLDGSALHDILLLTSVSYFFLHKMCRMLCWLSFCLHANFALFQIFPSVLTFVQIKAVVLPHICSFPAMTLHANFLKWPLSLCCFTRSSKSVACTLKTAQLTSENAVMSHLLVLCLLPSVQLLLHVTLRRTLSYESVHVDWLSLYAC